MSSCRELTHVCPGAPNTIAANKIVPGKFQFDVQSNGILELSNLVITGSHTSSAIVSKGDLVLVGVIMERNGLTDTERKHNNAEIHCSRKTCFNVPAAAIQLLGYASCTARSCKFLDNDAGRTTGALGNSPKECCFGAMFEHYLGATPLKSSCQTCLETLSISETRLCQCACLYKYLSLYIASS